MQSCFCLTQTRTISGAYLVKLLTPQDIRDSAFSATHYEIDLDPQAARFRCLAWAKRRNMVQCTVDEIDALASVGRAL